MWVALVSASIAAALPSTPALPGLDTLHPDRFVRQFLRAAPWTLWLVTVGSAIAFQLTPLITVYWPLPALLLPATVRDRHANAMACHRLYLVRMAMVMVKTVGGLYWGAHPQVRKALGLPAYAPDPQSWRDAALQPIGGPIAPAGRG